VPIQLIIAAGDDTDICRTQAQEQRRCPASPFRPARPPRSRRRPLLDAVERQLGVVANVALNLFTNFVNNVAETEIDFPLMRAEFA
jgi:hypothetical protein